MQGFLDEGIEDAQAKLSGRAIPNLLDHAIVAMAAIMGRLDRSVTWRGGPYRRGQDLRPAAPVHLHIPPKPSENRPTKQFCFSRLS